MQDRMTSIIISKESEYAKVANLYELGELMRTDLSKEISDALKIPPNDKDLGQIVESIKNKLEIKYKQLA